jgi:cytochrome c oxidase subunit 2
VGFIIASILSNKLVNRSILENQTIEIVWTLLPSVILLFIAFPSLRLLYLLDEVLDPALTLKTIGHQ